MALLSFDLAGVRVRLDASWLLLALLISWSLATDFFPMMHPGLAIASYWTMAACTAAGVAVSIVLHEMGHTLVARGFGVHVRSITLFIFGGVADLQKEPDRPWPELVIALAGPLVSLVLSALLAGLALAVKPLSPTEVTGVLGYLATLNFALAVFNMAPAFPLDGGRVLRAVVWIATKDSLKATKVAARSGEIIAWVMMGLGVTVLLTTGFLQGLWWLILGYFVYSLARAHRADADAKAALSGLNVADIMTTNLVTAPADISVADFLTDYLTPHPHALIPLQDKGAYIGAAGLRQVKAVPRAQWETTPVGAIAIPLADIPAIGADVAVEDALEQMQSARAMRLLVRGEGRVLGVLAMSDIMAHVKFRNDLAAS